MATPEPPSPSTASLSSPAHPGRWWHRLPDGRVQCDLCPRLCKLAEGQRGFCFVRQGQAGAVVLTTYGRSSGFCIDPIEKKPLNHFLPGTAVLSFGTAGCNLGCRFCQNWSISKARAMDQLMDTAAPEAIAAAAAAHGCRSVAFTYNDPVIFAEYSIDTAAACHARGLQTVAVTAGEILDPARAEFFAAMDATNIDLKGFTPKFYRDLCLGSLQPVLETLEYVHRHTRTWLEVTTLLIPGHNDGEAELTALAEWIATHLGPEVPLHSTSFHPDFRLRDVAPTPTATLRRARELARQVGLQHVYCGNVRDEASASTCCPACGTRLIGRLGYDLSAWALTPTGGCPACGHRLAGIFESAPGQWGSRRQPIRIAS